MRRILILSFLALLVVGRAAPAWAGSPGGSDGVHVVLTGGLDVPASERPKAIVVFNGPVTIEGDVRGSAVVFNGRVLISGTVRDDVVVFNGRVELAAGARVGGDLVTRQRPSIDPSATIDGDIRRLRNLSISFGFVLRGAVWLAYTLSTLVLGLILVAAFRRGMEVAAGVSRTRVGAAIAWGAGLFFGLPLAGILLLVTVIGIPLGLALLLALWFIYTVGYTASLFFVGRRMVKPPRRPVVAFLAGWGVMRALALIPFLGGLLWFVAAVYGLGVLAATASSARREPVPLPPPPPVPTQA